MKKPNLRYAFMGALMMGFFMAIPYSYSYSGTFASPKAETAKEVANDFTRAAKQAIPAVVSIKVQMNDRSRFSGRDEGGGFQDPSDFFNDDFWSHFFRTPRQESRSVQIGQGSGFFVSPQGHILTNNHIVRDADKIIVTTSDEKELVAKVIGQDPSTDLAVIKVEGKNFPFLQLGNSDQLEVGQWVMAIGNPFGLQATLTVGVVSAKDRNNLGLVPFEDFIQTDAAINVGNSGGPLMDLEGKVVGINTALATRTGGYMGIGFAIPSRLAQHVMEQLINEGSVKRGYLGIALQPLNGDLAAAFGMEKPNGVLIAEVSPGSEAEKARLKQGDVIIKYNGKNVESLSSFRNDIAMMKPGSTLKMTLLRDKKPMEVSLTIGAHPENDRISDAASSKLGLGVEEITPERAQALRLGDEKGVVVTRVEPGSLGAWMGIKKGAVVLSVNQKQITTPDQFYQTVKETPNDTPILLLIKQDQATRFISIRAE